MDKLNNEKTDVLPNNNQARWEALLQYVAMLSEQETSSSIDTNGFQKPSSDDKILDRPLKHPTSAKHKGTDRESQQYIRAKSSFTVEDSFVIEVKPHPIYKRVVYVPKPFSEVHLKGDLQWWKIVTNDGREWKVKHRISPNRRSEIKLEGDWLDFYEKNQLKFEDACLFELVEGQESTLKVMFFRE